MITTIQLNNNVKKALNRMKEKSNESYEEVIVKMLRFIERQKRQQTKLLVEGYREMAGESLKITKEFEAIDEDSDWEWK